MLIKPSQSDEHKQGLKALRAELAKNQLLSKPDVQGLVKTAYATFSPAIYKSVTGRLHLILDVYNTDADRKPDSFRPYGPELLLSKGDLHLIDQMDGVRFITNSDGLVTGAIVIGPQGSGKSRLVTHLCEGISTAKPNVRITLIDPKNGFKTLPGFRHIESSKTSLDFRSPSNTNQQYFIYEFMPVLADTCSLIYGLDFVNQAVDIALSQSQQYNKHIGEDMTLCLRDIYEALKTIKASNFRLIGYLDAAKTALSLVLGKQGLFSCRKGLSLEWLFSENTVIDARSLTSQLQCKVFLIFMLFWLYQRAKNMPESKELKHVIIIDDATRFSGVANQFDAQKRTSQLGHILAVLRAAGICVIFVTQLPAQIDPAVLSLSRSMFVVGNVSGEENLRVIQNFMSLTPEQKNAILRFQTRETLAFVSGSVWPYPVHGWVPFVDDLPAQNISCIDLSAMISPWHSLTEIPQEKIINQPTVDGSKNTQQASPNVSAKPAQQQSPFPVLGPDAHKFLFDCVINPYDKVSDHIKRMNMSVRTYETIHPELTQKGFIQPSSAGKSVYLIPTEKAYKLTGYIIPYKRATSIEHAFYVNLASSFLKRAGFKVQIETPIGKKGQTIDTTTVDKSGDMTAFEITLNTSNLLSNAAKLQGTAYQKIVWLCRDNATAKAVKAYFNKSTSLPTELTNKFEYEFFSKWTKKSSKGRK